GGSSPAVARSRADDPLRAPRSVGVQRQIGRRDGSTPANILYTVVRSLGGREVEELSSEDGAIGRATRTPRRRRGSGMYGRLQREAARRRRADQVRLAMSLAALVGLVALSYKLLAS